LPVSALPSGFGVGNFGRGAYEFIDFLKDAGFSVWQILPLCMTDEKNSPYKSCASFSISPSYLDPDALVGMGLIEAGELAPLFESQPYLCEYERGVERNRILALAAERAREREELSMAVDEWMEGMPSVASTAKFLALSEMNGTTEWQRWETHTPDQSLLFKWRFIQYELYREWLLLKAYANERGISIIGDIPMYVDLFSEDAWASPHLFKLDGEGYPTEVAGVPPDAFAEDGQLWGNPLYDWAAMRREGFKWWRERLSLSLKLYDGVRIDHFRAFESYWSVPRGAKSAKEGKWIKGPGKPFIRVIREMAGDATVIAEDLGVITREVRDLLDYSGLPGMRVLQFAFGDAPDTPHLPHNYIENCVAYTGTHDNNTLLGYLYELDGDVRRTALEYTGASREIREACFDIIKMLLRSPAALVIIPIQDILAYGKDTRINTPGVPDGNWVYRLTRSQLDGIDRCRLCYYNRMYDR